MTDLIEYTNGTDADSSGCMSVPPSTFNGGGGAGRDCPRATYDSFQDCVDYYKHTYGLSGAADHCEDVCFGTVEGGSYPEPDDPASAPTFYFDTDEYIECLLDKISDINREMAICIIGVVSVPVIIAAAIAIGGISIPEPATTAAGGISGSFAIGVTMSAMIFCSDLSFFGAMRHTFDTLWCGVQALKHG